MERILTDSFLKPAFCLIITAVVFVAAVGCGLMTSPKSESDVEPPSSGSAPNSVSVSSGGVSTSPSSSSATETSSASDNTYSGSEYYLKLVENKAEITKVVAERVEQYRNGTPPDNPNHHPPYPADFPPASQLPVITSPEQFAIREEANIDALGAFYAAVRIDSTHEMRIDISQHSDGGTTSWGSGNTWLVSVADRGYYGWVLTDLDIHNGELPADFMGRALSRGLTQEQVKSLITQSLREEEILNLPMEEIDFIFYMSEAANTVDSEGFTTLDFIQLTSMNEDADSEWVQAGDSFLGMMVKSVYAKGVPYAPYLAAAIGQDVQFAGATRVGGRFEKRDDGLVFIVSENEQGGMPSLHSPSSDTIVFNNQQTAEKIAAATPDAFTECRIIIENYRIQTTNDTVKMVYDEAGEVTDYTADDSKTVLVQSADIRQT